MKKHFNIRKLLFNVSLSILSSVAIILILELFLQIYFHRWNHNQSVPFLLVNKVYEGSEEMRNFIQESKKKGIIFELKPNVKGTLLDKPFVTNSQGLLGAKDFVNKKPDTIRIAGVGDSVMSSWGVHYDDTYLELLKNKLGPLIYPNKIEVINFAVPGYNTAIEFEVIRQKVLQYDPDIIILGIEGNDYDMPNYLRRKIHAKSYLWYLIKAYLKPWYSQLKTYLDKNYLDENEIDTLLADAKWNDDEGRFPYNFDEVSEEYHYMIGEENFQKSMDNISKITIQKEIPVIASIRFSKYFSDSIPKLKNMGFLVHDARQDVNKYIEDANIEWKDIIIDFENRDTHFNELGHQLYSQALYEFILDNAQVIPKLNIDN